MIFSLKPFTIARFTFLELYKSRILINVLLLGLALLLVSYVATEFTFGVPAKVALDFGLGVTSLSSIAISIFMGANLLLKEVENRTLYMILSRPVARAEFLIGRVLGLLGILFVNIVILMSLTSIMYFYLGGEFSNLIIWNFIFTYLECSITLLIVILFSMMANQTISIINTITVVIAGHAISTVSSLTFANGNIVIKNILSLGKYTLPNLGKLNIKNFLIYNNSLPMDYLLGGLFYGFSYMALLLVISIFIFNHKSLD